MSVNMSTEQMRDRISDLIEDLEQQVAARPDNGAELALGLRKLQEGRMWLGVAEAKAKGHNPWRNKIEPKTTETGAE